MPLAVPDITSVMSRETQAQEASACSTKPPRHLARSKLGTGRGLVARVPARSRLMASLARFSAASRIL